MWGDYNLLTEHQCPQRSCWYVKDNGFIFNKKPSDIPQYPSNYIPPIIKRDLIIVSGAITFNKIYQLAALNNVDLLKPLFRVYAIYWIPILGYTGNTEVGFWLHALEILCRAFDPDKIVSQAFMALFNNKPSTVIGPACKDSFTKLFFAKEIPVSIVKQILDPRVNMYAYYDYSDTVPFAVVLEAYRTVKLLNQFQDFIDGNL